MNREQLRLAEKFIRRLGLKPGQYDKKEHRWVSSICHNLAPLQFGYVALRDQGHMIVYASGDFLDPKKRFIAQSKNHRAARYKFCPDDEEAWAYAARVVLSAYRSRL